MPIPGKAGPMRQPIPSRKARLNEEQSHVSTRLTRQNAPETPTPEPSDDELPSSPISSPTIDIPIPNVDELTFELSTTSFLDSERINCGFVIVKLGKFRVRRYLAETITNVEKHAATTGFAIEWSKGEAQLQHKGLTKTNQPLIDVHDEDS